MKKILAPVVLTIFFLSACSHDVQVKNQHETEPSLTLPIAQYSDRLTFKAFGEFIQDRFRGYHVGDDIEYEDEPSEVPVLAIADGKIVYRENTEGYGGLMVIEHNINHIVITALYGHLDVLASAFKKGDIVNKGQFLAYLGDGQLPETDGERKHLHFGLYEDSELRLNGYESSAQKVESWINPYEFFRTQGVITRKKSRTFHPATDLGGDHFPIEFTIPEGWEIEYIPSLKALNLFTLSGASPARQRSQILIRFFDAAKFLTLPTVNIYSTTDLTVGKGHYTARRYDIEKKQGVPDFADQPAWRNQRHLVTDFRGSEGFTRYFVVAANPLLDHNIVETVLKSMAIVHE